MTLPFFAIIKFGLVGISGLIIDFSITWIAKEKLAFNKYLANSLGFISAVVNNYYWNRTWTFENANPAVFKQFLLFLSASLIGLMLNNLFLFLFHHKIGISFYWSKLFSIGLVFIWNITINFLFIFSE